jgi:hypothetical protein
VNTKESATARAVRRLRSKRCEVRWTIPPFERSVGATADPREARAGLHQAKPPAPTRRGSAKEAAAVAAVVDDAVRIRARAARTRSEKVLRKMGVRAQTVERRGKNTAPVPVVDVRAEAAPENGRESA